MDSDDRRILMFENRTIRRLEQMLDAALSGDFQERDYDETSLSRLETKWKRFSCHVGAV